MNETCEGARRAIEKRSFVGWRGLPNGCSSGDMFGIPGDAAWLPRDVGRPRKRVLQHGVELDGYARALANTRDGVLVMFDGHLPELDGGWTALADDLGSPEASLDYTNGLAGVVPQGELVYAGRGITVFVDKPRSRVVHVAVYPPTTVEDWERELRFDLAIKRRDR